MGVVGGITPLFKWWMESFPHLYKWCVALPPYSNGGWNLFPTYPYVAGVQEAEDGHPAGPGVEKRRYMAGKVILCSQVLD